MEYVLWYDEDNADDNDGGVGDDDGGATNALD